MRPLGAERSQQVRPLLFILLGSLIAVTGCTPETGGGGALGPNGDGSGGNKFSIFRFREPEPPAPHPNAVWPPRALWVVRQAYRSPEQIATLMETIRQTGFNTVLFQVRGNGTAFYRSSIEPLDYEFKGDPGFDVLEVACREAHRRGLALHAWVNVMPAWRSNTPPTDPRQLYNAHPDWFWYDQRGRRQPLGKFYVSLNPCRPEVRRYLTGVFGEIVRKYPVDGLHLDYIRFPTDESPRGVDYPYDAETLALYRQATGKRPQDNKTLWTSWRTRQVTQLVREIRQMTNSARRSVRLTAACGPDFESWKANHFQDGPTWLRERLVDLVFVMNYNNDSRAFARRQQAWHRAAPGCWIAAGINASTTPTTLEQLRLAAQWGHGFSIFSSNSLLADSPRVPQRLEAVRQYLLSMQPRPTAMLDDPGPFPTLVASR